MSSRTFDMCFVRKFDVMFLELDSPFLIDASSDIILREPSEEFSILSFYSEVECLSFERFLYFKCFFETFAGLVLLAFFLGFKVLEPICCYLSNHSFWYERVPSLRRGDFDNLTLASEVSNILEEFDGELVGWHKASLESTILIYKKSPEGQELNTLTR